MNKAISFPVAIIIIIVCAVLAGGLVVWQYLGVPEKVLEPVSSSETADWKTYRDKECGFELKYPPDWYVKESSKCYFLIENIKEKVIVAGGDDVVTENGSYFVVSIHENTSGFSSIEEKIKSYDLPDREKQRRLDNIITMKFGDVELIVWDMVSGIEFIKGDKGGTIHGASGSGEQFNKDLETFKKILSTFRFLE